MAITSCFYMYVRPIPAEFAPQLPRTGFGYISRQVKVLEPPNYQQCVFWDSAEKQEYFDSMWRAGKAMSLLACTIGGIVMGIMICTCCVAFQLPTFEGLFWTCMFCFVAQALTFLSWGSTLCNDYECTWSSGTGMNITAAMLWVWAANMIKSFPEALPPRGRGRKPPLYDDRGEPYAAGGFEDEYDYDGEEGDFENDGEYYDDYDDEYYDDPDQEYYDDQEDNHEEEPEGYIDAEGHAQPNDSDPYETDYQDPEPIEDRRYKQGRDDEFEANSHFNSTSDDTSHFSSSEDSNAFRQLTSEEQRFIEGGRHNSFRGID